MIGDDVQSIDDLASLVARLLHEHSLPDGSGWAGIPDLSGVVPAHGHFVTRRGNEWFYFAADSTPGIPQPHWRGTDTNELLYLILKGVCFEKASQNRQKGLSGPEGLAGLWQSYVRFLMAIEPEWKDRLFVEYDEVAKRMFGDSRVPLKLDHYRDGSD